MHIFINESGSFTPQSNTDKQQDETNKKQVRFDCLVGVVMSEECCNKWSENYSAICKGSDLEIDSAAEIINFLGNNGAKIFVVGTDLVFHSEKTLQGHYDWFRKKSLKNNINIKDRLDQDMEYISKLKGPLYLKTLLIVQLIENIISNFHSIEKLNFYIDIIHKNYESETTKAIKDFIYIKLRGLPVNINISFISDDKCCGIKASDCIANFFYGAIRGVEKRNFDDNTIKIFEKLLIKDHSIDLLHFNKDEPFIDIDKLSENGKNFCNKINIEFYMVKTL